MESVREVIDYEGSETPELLWKKLGDYCAEGSDFCIIRCATWKSW